METVSRSAITMESSQNHYGSFTLRFFACVFDQLLLWQIPLLGLLMIFALASSIKEVWIGMLWLIWEVLLVQWIIGLVYQVITFVRFQASLGKMFAGLEIQMLDGERPTLRDALLRFPIGYVVSGLLWGLGFFWISRDQKRQGFHDHIAGTVVVKRNTSRPLVAGLTIVIFLTVSLTFSIYILGLQRGIWSVMISEFDTMIRLIR